MFNLLCFCLVVGSFFVGFLLFFWGGGFSCFLVLFVLVPFALFVLDCFVIFGCSLVVSFWLAFVLFFVFLGVV